MNIDTLYSAISFVSIDGREGVIVYWYFDDAPRWDESELDNFIQNFSSMDGKVKRITKELLNRLFTKREISLLRENIKSLFGDVVYTLELPLPLKPSLEAMHANTCSHIPYIESDPASKKILQLNQIEGCNLPFKANGIFNPLSGIPEGNNLTDDLMNAGRFFLSKALDRLAPDAEWDESAVNSILTDIYQGTGHYVDQKPIDLY